jgi:uncharacterized protein YkwD
MNKLLLSLCVFVAGCRVEIAGENYFIGYSERCPSSLDNELLTLVNQQRQAGRYCGDTYYPAVAPLIWHTTVAAVAVDHAVDMARYNYLSETASDGTSFSIRLNSNGYYAASINTFIGSGYDSTAAALAAWLSYPQQCAALMSPDFVHLGGGCADRADSQAGTYWDVLITLP